MSQEVLQMVRAGYDAYNRGDVEAALATLHPNIEWWPADDEPITDPYRGHEGYRKLVAGARRRFRTSNSRLRNCSASAAG
jgi:ketosteroid isomerase-like protein